MVVGALCPAMRDIYCVGASITGRHLRSQRVEVFNTLEWRLVLPVCWLRKQWCILVVWVSAFASRGLLLFF